LINQRQRERSQIDLVDGQRDFAGLGAREDQQLIDQPLEFVDLFQLTGEAAPHLAGV